MASSENKVNKSKKETFSNINIDNDHNFQTANMEYKMKKIKKKSKSKIKNNFKNIETFDTLYNEDTHKKKHTSEEDEKEKPSKEVENFDTLSSIFTNKVVEGAANLDDKENRDNWEGHDNVKDEEKKIDWRDKGVKFVENVYDKLTFVNRKLSKEITYALSNNNPTEKDEELMGDYLSTLFIAVVSLPITFNWYYVMYCVPKEKLFNMSVQDFKEKSKEPGFEILKLILFLFEFAFFFPSALNYLIIDFFPAITGKYLNGKINFMLVFFAVFYGLKKLSVHLKNMLIAIIKDSSNHFIVNIMFATVFINFFVSLFSMDFEEMFSFFSSPIFFIVKNIVRFILVIIISVPVGALLIFLYLIIYSLFATLIYGKGSIAKSFMDVNSHTETSSPYLSNMSCDDDSFFSILIRNLLKIVGFMKKHLVLIVVIFIIVRYTFIFRTELSNTEGIVPGMSFRDSFMFFNLLLFVTVGTWMYIGFMKQVDDAMKSKDA
jgi:hypothetical protein